MMPRTERWWNISCIKNVVDCTFQFKYFSHKLPCIFVFNANRRSIEKYLVNFNRYAKFSGKKTKWVTGWLYSKQKHNETISSRVIRKKKICASYQLNELFQVHKATESVWRIIGKCWFQWYTFSNICAFRERGREKIINFQIESFNTMNCDNANMHTTHIVIKDYFHSG